MSELYVYPNEESYVRSQKKGTMRRFYRRPAVSESEIKAIADYIRGRGIVPSNGICHGARCGTEVKLFRGEFPEMKVHGTDLNPIDKENVLEWDFHRTHRRWHRYFDFLYSNSLDHSNRPEECVRTWLGQLKPDGLAFVQWTLGHLHGAPKSRLPRPGGDCFGAALHEYIVLFQRFGVMYDLIYHERSRKYMSIIVVAGPRVHGKQR